MLEVVISARIKRTEYQSYKDKKVKVCHSLIAIGAVGVRVSLYLGQS